jgi:tetratricopeptide (TPR) repeat protein
VPNAPDDMVRAVDYVQTYLSRDDLEDRQRVEALGLLGVFLRMLGDLSAAAEALVSAVDISSQAGLDAATVANRIRLANVYQWKHQFELADTIYEAVIQQCERGPAVQQYLDFAMQHYGKNLFDQRRYREAMDMFERALELRQAGGDTELIESTTIALLTTRSRLSG